MSTGLVAVLGVLAGLAVGAGIVWAALSRRAAQLATERDAARDDSASQRDAAAQLRAQLASVEADRGARIEEMAKQQAELEARTKEIAAEVSEANRARFMSEFRDLTTEQTKTASKTVSELVEPMRERLKELHEHVEKADKARVDDTAKVSQSVDQLVSETNVLRQILGDSKMRGAWGEQHLHNVIKAAGMVPHVDYIEQGTVGEAGGDARLRPDVVVKVPDGASVVIDAKTPLAAYARAVQASDQAERQQALAEHAAALSQRAKELGDRNYGQWVAGSPDFVLMYVPTDPMLDVAMDADRDVWQNAWHRHSVLIATPGLLIAFLRTVALAWQRQDIARNAEKVASLGNELHSRLSKYLEHIDKMGRGLRSAVSAYNDSVGSFERMVLPQARRFRELGSVTASNELDNPAPVEAEIRSAEAPELHQADDEHG